MSSLTKATDYLGNEICVGDTVVFVEKSYRNFLTGQIKSIAPKTVLIEFEHPEMKWRSGTYRADHNFVIKVPDRVTQ